MSTKNGESPRKIIGHLRADLKGDELAQEKTKIESYCNDHDLKSADFVQGELGDTWKDDRGVDFILGCAYAREVSVIVFSELFAIGRSIGEIYRRIDMLVKKSSIEVHFIKEKMVLHPGLKYPEQAWSKMEKVIESEKWEGVSSKKWKKVRTKVEEAIRSEVQLEVFSFLVKAERTIVTERMKNAMRSRKAAGVILGRPAGKSKLDAHEDMIRQKIEEGIMQKALAKKLGCTPVTLSNWLKRKRKEWATKKDN